MSATYRTLELRGAERAGGAYDDVTRPSHYCHGGFEAKEVIMALLEDADLLGGVDWWWGNGLKYAFRWPFKGETVEERVRDLDKAIKCLTECKRAYLAGEA